MVDGRDRTPRRGGIDVHRESVDDILARNGLAADASDPHPTGGRAARRRAAEQRERAERDVLAPDPADQAPPNGAGRHSARAPQAPPAPWDASRPVGDDARSAGGRPVGSPPPRSVDPTAARPPATGSPAWSGPGADGRSNGNGAPRGSRSPGAGSTDGERLPRRSPGPGDPGGYGSGGYGSGGYDVGRRGAGRGTGGQDPASHGTGANGAAPHGVAPAGSPAEGTRAWPSPGPGSAPGRPEPYGPPAGGPPARPNPDGGAPDVDGSGAHGTGRGGHHRGGAPEPGPRGASSFTGAPEAPPAGGSDGSGPQGPGPNGVDRRSAPPAGPAPDAPRRSGGHRAAEPPAGGPYGPGSHGAGPTANGPAHNIGQDGPAHNGPARGGRLPGPDQVPTARHIVGPNGVGPNGVGPNRVGPNRVGPNRVGPNSVGPNSVGPNSVGPNGAPPPNPGWPGSVPDSPASWPAPPNGVAPQSPPHGAAPVPPFGPPPNSPRPHRPSPDQQTRMWPPPQVGPPMPRGPGEFGGPPPGRPMPPAARPAEPGAGHPDPTTVFPGPVVPPAAATTAVPFPTTEAGAATTAIPADRARPGAPNPGRQGPVPQGPPDPQGLPNADATTAVRAPDRTADGDPADPERTSLTPRPGEQAGLDETGLDETRVTPRRSSPRDREAERKAATSRIDESLIRMTAAHAGMDLSRSDSDDDGDDDDDGKPVVSGRRRAGRIAVRLVGAAMALVVLGAAGLGWGTKRWLDTGIRDAGALDLASSAIVDAAAQRGDENVLVVASDPAKDPATRADTVVVAHVPAGGGPVVVLSVPHNLEINRPSCDRWDAATATYTNEPEPAEANTQLVTALDIGGPRCVTRAVQQLTGLAITQYVGLDLGAVEGLSAAMRGVEVCVPTPVVDGALGTIVADPGTNRLDGVRAADFVRAMDVTGDPASEYGRIDRQQKFLAAVLDRTLDERTLLDVGQVQQLRPALRAALLIDGDGLDTALAVSDSLHRLDAPGVVFAAAPTTGGTDGVANAVLRDADAAAVFAAVRDGRDLPEQADDPTEAVAGPAPADLRVQLLNASDVPGRAEQVGGTLGTLGFGVGEVGNADQPTNDTIIKFSPDQAAGAALLASTVPSATSVPDPGSTGVLQLVLGRSFDDVIQPPVAPAPVDATVAELDPSTPRTNCS